MKWTRIFVLVSCGALAGMVMGGLFGFGAGSIAPTFFAHLILGATLSREASPQYSAALPASCSAAVWPLSASSFRF
jgi:hypothetical protein